MFLKDKDEFRKQRKKHLISYSSLRLYYIFETKVNFKLIKFNTKHI